MARKMKIWDLRPIDFKIWKSCSYGLVVVAPTEKRARKAASESSGDEWLNSSISSCRELIAEEFSCDCVILSDDVFE